MHGFALEELETTIGDIGYADDTAIVGWETEVRTAERLFLQTLVDWEERANEGKTERLRITGREGRMPYAARGVGEKDALRHVGGWLSE